VAQRRRESHAERRQRRAEVDDPAVVLEAAARFLEVRPRSVAEVRQRLTSTGYRAELVDEAITRLGDLGILDDEAFARAWVESRDRARPRGERAFREELRLKGVERTVIEAVLDERRMSSDDGSDADEPGPDRRAAERLIARNTRALERVADPRQRRQRAYALLARHGFDPDTCREVAARVGSTATEVGDG
jgi:regulatory protein